MLLKHFGVETVLDVGAHHGEYGLRLRKGGYDGKIVSFEPGPDAFSVLEQRCKRDGNWACHQMALGDEIGQGELNVMKFGASRRSFRRRHTDRAA